MFPFLRFKKPKFCPFKYIKRHVYFLSNPNQLSFITVRPLGSWNLFFLSYKSSRSVYFFFWKKGFKIRILLIDYRIKRLFDMCVSLRFQENHKFCLLKWLHRSHRIITQICARNYRSIKFCIIRVCFRHLDQLTN